MEQANPTGQRENPEPVLANQFSSVAGQGPTIITSGLDIKSYKPDATIIRAAQIELHKISPYLHDLPRDAKAWLLVAPQDLMDIDDEALGTWHESIKRISGIKKYHGLNGMPISDRPATDPHMTYEQDWASQVRIAFDQAQRTEQPVTTGLFLGTKQIVFGKNESLEFIEERIPNALIPLISSGRWRAVNAHTIPNDNLFSLRNEIADKGGEFRTEPLLEGFIEKLFSGKVGELHCQWTSSAVQRVTNVIYFADFSAGELKLAYKQKTKMSARPVALEILPPGI